MINLRLSCAIYDKIDAARRLFALDSRLRGNDKGAVLGSYIFFIQK